MKKKRIVNKDLLKSYREKSCEICGTYRNTVAHHIKSVGSGGNDVTHNLIPLCIEHHVEIHKIGINKTIHKYPHLKYFLQENGWEKCEITNRWFHIKRYWFTSIL